MNVKVKISALLLCAALLFDTVGAAAATGFEDKRLEVVAGRRSIGGYSERNEKNSGKRRGFALS